MKLFFLVLGFSSVGIVCQSQNLDKLLNKCEKANGGKSLLTRYNNFQVLSRLEEFGSYVADSFYSRYSRTGKLMVEAHIKPDIIYTEGISNDTAWEQPSPSSPKKMVRGRPFISLYRAVRWPNHIKSIRQFKNEGNSVQLGNMVVEDGKKYYVLELRIAGDSLTRSYFINATTYLITKQRDHRPLHPGEKEKTIETIYSDYRMVNGLMIAFKSEEWDYGLNKRLTLTELKEILFNSKFDERIFGLK